MLMDVLTTCQDAALLNVLALFRRVLLLIQIIVPILLLVAATVEFVNLMINPDKKGGLKGIVNKALAAVVVLLLPFLMNFVMGVIGESTNFSSCWNEASNPNPNVEYVDPNGNDSRTKVVQ